MRGVVFLSCWLFGMGCPALELLVVEWSWVLALRRRSLGKLSLIDITWGQEVSDGPMS